MIGQEPNLFTNQRLVRHFLRTAFPLEPLSVRKGEQGDINGFSDTCRPVLKQYIYLVSFSFLFTEWL